MSRAAVGDIREDFNQLLMPWQLQLVPCTPLLTDHSWVVEVTRCSFDVGQKHVGDLDGLLGMKDPGAKVASRAAGSSRGRGWCVVWIGGSSWFSRKELPIEGPE